MDTPIFRVIKAFNFFQSFQTLVPLKIRFVVSSGIPTLLSIESPFHKDRVYNFLGASRQVWLVTRYWLRRKHFKVQHLSRQKILDIKSFITITINDPGSSLLTWCTGNRIKNRVSLINFVHSPSCPL